MSTNHSFRVLVVDDDEDSRELMESALSVAGFSTSAAPHAEAAIEQMQTQVPDVVITDLTLPQMSGEDLATHVRSQKQLAKILMVATSGRELSPATRSLFDLVRPKPVDFDSLIEGMNALLKLRTN